MKAIKKFLIIISILLNTSSIVLAWEQKQDYPVAAGADGGISFTINDIIYVGGGLGSKEFRSYDPATDQWTSLGLLPGVVTDRGFGIGFAINGKGYVGLGIDGFIAKKDMWQFDPFSNSWTQMQDFPGQARDGLYAFVIDNLAYIGAGEDPFTLVKYNEAYSFDPFINSWAQLSDFPTTGVIYPFSFAIDQKGYVSCGESATGASNLTFEYEPSTDTWTQKANFIGSERQAGVSFVLNGIAYCGLGMNATFVNDFYSYDPSNDAWSMADSLPAPARSFPVAAVAGNSAFVGLGWSFALAETYHKDWWEFSLSTGQDDLGNKISKVNVYPNPVIDILYLNIRGNEKYYFEIINIVGDIVKRGEVEGTENKIDLTNVSAGSYTLFFRNEKFTQTEKLVKK
jgi:hypothetical protein